MFVSRSMVSQVITIDKDASVFEAQEKMSANGIRPLPVVEADNRLIGIVTDRDIRSAMPYRMIKEEGSSQERERLAQLKVEDIMTRNPRTISPMFTIQDALLMIQKEKVGAFPRGNSKGFCPFGICCGHSSMSWVSASPAPWWASRWRKRSAS